MSTIEVATWICAVASVLSLIVAFLALRKGSRNESAIVNVERQLALVQSATHAPSIATGGGGGGGAGAHGGDGGSVNYQPTQNVSVPKSG